MRILFLSRWFPYPPDNGSKIRIFNILKQLSRQHEVALLTFCESTDRVDDSSLVALREICSDVRVLPYRPYHPSSAKALAGFLSSQPRFLVDTRSEAMRAAVVEGYGKHMCDLVLASELGMMPYALALPGEPALLEDLELSVFSDSQGKGYLAHRGRSFLTWMKLRNYLRQTLPRFAACTVVSEAEKRNLRKIVPGYRNVTVVPNAVDLVHYQGDFGPAQSNSLVFSGALTYSANYDGLCYFLSEAYPLIVRAVPDVVLRVTGSTEGVDLASLPVHPGVEYTGYVDDIRPVIARSWVSVVPLRVGGGTRLKILEAMALGTPVVSTSKGAEGLYVTDGESILIADDPAELAAKVVSLLRSSKQRDQLSAAGLRLVESGYDWSVVGQDLCVLVEQVGTLRAGQSDAEHRLEGTPAEIPGSD